MSIQFFCPLGHMLTAEARQAGEEIRCTLCGQRAIVPELPVGSAEATAGGHNGSQAGAWGTSTPTSPVPPSTPLPVGIALPTASTPPVEATAPSSADTGAPPAAIAWQDAYRAEPDKFPLVVWLALGLGLVAMFGATPAMLHFRAQPAPTWVWLAMFAAVLQGLFIVWMVVTPDWATLRVVTLFFLLVALGYGLVTLRALGASLDEPLPWGLDSVRPWAPRWCASVLLITTLGAYLCGHLSVRWRRAFKLGQAVKSARRKSAA